MAERKAGFRRISDQSVRARTGKGFGVSLRPERRPRAQPNGWDHWFRILGWWGAPEQGHTNSARHLRDKVAVVTGGSRGIGRSMALGLADEGCHVAICARGEERLRETEAEVRERVHGGCCPHQGTGHLHRPLRQQTGLSTRVVCWSRFAHTPWGGAAQATPLVHRQTSR